MKKTNVHENGLSSIDIDLILASGAEFITIRMLERLVSKGALADTIHPDSGRAAIHYLCLLSNRDLSFKMVKYLVDNCGIDPDLPDNTNSTPLHLASISENELLVEYLSCQKNVDVNHVNDMNETPIFGALIHLNKSIVRSLLKAGADPDREFDDGNTLISEAEDLGYIDLVSLINEYKYKNTSQRKIKLYDKEFVSRMLDEIKSSESPLIHHLETLANRDERRIMKSIDGNVIEKLESLKIKFPNFDLVINYVIEQASLALLSENPYFSMSPLLMTGGAGVGKTRFTKELSKALNLEFTNIDGGNTTGSQTFGGSDSVWRDSKPGRVCDHLRLSSNANPFILIDEIDKMSSTQSDPYGPLHPLLEKETSKYFVDEFYKVPFDCSHIVWVATANCISSVPEPILDRFYPIDVPDPTIEQMPLIVVSIYSDIINSDENPWGSKFGDALSNDVVNELGKVAPRKLKKKIITAMGIVARELATGTRSEAGKIELTTCDFKDTREKIKVQCGFS